jgi:uncharacterized protein YecT (DUF1311 family)
MIIGSSPLRAFFIAGIAIFIASCDSGTPSRTRDDIAADSALASDLALANRDTTLVDSIGAYRPPDAAERVGSAHDSSAIAIVPEKPVATARTVVIPKPIPAPAPAPKVAAPVTIAPPATVAAPQPSAPTPSKAVASVPTRHGAAACSSSLPADQQECVHATLASVDGRLNRIYRALLTETRRQEHVAPGASNPASVERLRVAQRAWLVYRDNECRRRGRGKEGALWARPRVKCLGEFSARRANELADNFSRLTAH